MERLEAKSASQGDCIEFIGYRDKNGYGRFGLFGKVVLAHRAAWQLTYGPIPDGMVVMHSCDNPPCVNIKHLSLGTQADNQLDMALKGRSRHSNVTHCKRGHEFTEENTYHFTCASGRPGRKCRTCSNEKDKIRKRKLRAERSNA